MVWVLTKADIVLQLQKECDRGGRYG